MAKQFAPVPGDEYTICIPHKAIADCYINLGDFTLITRPKSSYIMPAEYRLLRGYPTWVLRGETHEWLLPFDWAAVVHEAVQEVAV